MSLSVLSELDEIIEHVLNYLPMISLQKCARVCRKWNIIIQRLKRARCKPCWFLCHGSGETLSAYIEERLQLLAIEPRFALLFCTTSLQEKMIAVDQPTSSRHHRAAKCMRMQVHDYLASLLPPGCTLKGSATDGIVGTAPYKTLPAEFENSESLSCLLLPELRGVDIHPFSITTNSLERLSRRNTRTANQDATPATIEEITGIPEGKKPKLLVMLQTEPSGMYNKDKYLYKPILQHYQDVVIAGGYVDSLLPDDSQDIDQTNREEPSGVGIAFMGENIKVASVLIGRRVKCHNDVKQALGKLKSCHVPEQNAVGFMFACIGRGAYYYGQENVESSVFHSLFPNVPLLGFFGNGENGYDYLPDYSRETGGSGVRLLGQRYPDDETGLVMDMPPVEHSYCTVFVLLSLGTGK